jgi:hypothetical protein
LLGEPTGLDPESDNAGIKMQKMETNVHYTIITGDGTITGSRTYYHHEKS